MHRFPLAALIAALAVAAGAVGLVACGGSSNVSKNVTSAPGDGANDNSLYHADNLDSAIKKYTDKFGSDGISMVKIEPNSMKVTTSGGINVVTKDGDTQGLNLPSGVTVPKIGGGSDVSLADVDTSAPQKIVDSLKDKGVTFANVNYFLISPALTSVVSDSSSSAPGWLIYSEKGNFQAKADGSGAKPLGSAGSVSITTPDGTSVDTKKLDQQAKKAEDQAKTIASQATNAAKGVQDCVAKAGTDPQKLAACAGQ
jgi:hypothetical protein